MELKETFKCFKNIADDFVFLTGKALHPVTKKGS